MIDVAKYDVFISYRRDTGSELAQLVYQHLKRRGYRVFMDVRDLRSGAFDEELKQKISDSTDVVLLVTKNCFERCANEDDWFRVEIETALESGCNVVPLRTEEAVMPSPEDLPASISKISKHQSVKFNSAYCDAGLNRLCQLLKSPRRLARRRVVAIVAALLLLLIIGGAALVLISSNGASPTNTPPPTPLGLYWHGFGQRQRDGRWEEFFLRDGMTMHSGDQFRIVFRPSADCYVYVVNVDANARPSVLFPNREIERSHYCKANQSYQIPDRTNWFTLDEHEGNETIYLFASETPLEPMEKVLKQYKSADSKTIVDSLEETAQRLADETRGVSIEPDRRLAETTYSSGREVKVEMNLAAGRASAVEVIQFKHESR